MRQRERRSRAAAVAALVVVAAARALAQENAGTPSRRIVVSVADRKLALVERGRVVKVWATAVGAQPQPEGHLPRSIGRAASHGCIRMRNRDVEELFELVRVGDAVELRGERLEELLAETAEAEALVDTRNRQIKLERVL